MPERVEVAEFNIPGRWDWGYGEQVKQEPGKESGKDNLTRAANFPGKDLKRPVADRWERANFVEQVRLIKKRYEESGKTWKEYKQGKITEDEYKQGIKEYQQETKPLLSDVKVMDELYQKFLKEGKMVSVDMGKLGIQKAEYVYLTSSRTDFSKKVEVVVPGYSNNKHGGGIFSLIYALRTNAPVLLLTYFETPPGKMTDTTKKEVKRSKDFEPHVEFVEGAIDQILGKDSKFNITGVSAGGVIVAQLSKKKELANRIENINIIVPPGLAGVEKVATRIKMMHKSRVEAKKEGVQARLVTANEENIPTTKEDLKRYKSVKRHWVWRLAHEFNWWEEMTKKARVIIAEDDGITYGFKKQDKLMDNPNLSVRIVKGGHEAPGVYPEKVIEQMI